MPGGILVWVDRQSRPVEAAPFAAIAASERHRGVDGFRQRLLGPVALAQHNFHVSAHAELCPAEPRGDGTFVLLDGRLDHRHRLMAELGLGPAPCSDPELVVAAYGRWGTGWVEHIHGSVAAVIVDPARRRVLASRDELGRVPLYYHVAPGFILLASEPAAILRHPEVGKGLDAQWLSYYFGLFRSVVRDGTPFEQVKGLLPGQSLLWEGDQVRFIAARRRLGLGRVRYPRDGDYAGRFRELLVASIANVTAGYDRVGIMLSGGMDSCPVACLAAERFRQTGQQLTAYSWTLAGYPEADEAGPVRTCAEFAGIQTRLFAADDLWSLPEPVAWPTDINTPGANAFLKLFIEIYERVAADGDRILLQGTFGDNLYPKQWELADALSDRKFGLAARELAGLIRRNGLRALHRQPQVRLALKRLLHIRRLRGPQPPPWLTPRAAQALNFETWPPKAERHPRPNQFLALLGPDVSQRRFGFGYEHIRRGVYRCDPFHDWDLIDFMLSIPAYQCARLGQTKYLAREAMRGHMPEALRTRPRGSRLGSFFDAGFERSLDAMRRFLSRPECTWPEYVQHDFVMRGLSAGASPDTEKLMVWMALSYELWRQRLESEFGVRG